MNTIEEHVLDLIGEDSDDPDVFTDDATGMAQIRDSINDAIEDISIITGGYKMPYLLALRSDIGVYRLDFQKFHFAWVSDVWYIDQTRRLAQTDLVALNAMNPRWMTQTGTPELYYPVGNNHIGVWPIPSATTGVLEVRCVVIPARYTLDDERIHLREDLEWAAAHYAVSEYWASRGDAQSAVNHFNLVLERTGWGARYPMAQEYPYQLKTDKEPWPR